MPRGLTCVSRRRVWVGSKLSWGTAWMMRLMVLRTHLECWLVQGRWGFANSCRKGSVSRGKSGTKGLNQFSRPYNVGLLISANYSSLYPAMVFNLSGIGEKYPPASHVNLNIVPFYTPM